MKLLGNKDLRKGRITRQEVHCLGTWTWTRRWGEPSEEVPRWAVGADPLAWQGESCIDCNKEKKSEAKFNLKKVILFSPGEDDQNI